MRASAASSETAARAVGDGTALSPRTRRIALIVSGTFFIEQLDSTIIATAIPDISRSLGVAPLELNLAMTAYMLGLATFVPISGRIADRFGSRSVFGLATALFLLASVLCGLAQGLPMLVAARLLQGVGGAMMAPVGRLIVLRAASKAEMVEAMAWIMMPAMVAPMVGPLVGGVITTYVSWRWIFLVNIPMGVAAIYLIFRHIANEHQPAGGGFDIPGTCLLGASFAAFTIGLEFASRDWGSAGVGEGAALCLAGLAMFFLYWLCSRGRPSPVLDLTLLRVRSYRWSMAGGSLYRVGVGGIPFLLPVALQLGYGISPVQSGAIVLLPAVGGFVMKFLSTRILRGAGYWNVMVYNGLLSAGFMALLALAGPGWPWAAVAAVLVLFGLSRSLHMNAYGTLAYADLDKARMSSATSFFLAIQNLTVGFGVAISALSVRVFQSWLPQAAPATHFSLAFWALTALCIASTAVSPLLDRDAGKHLLDR